MPPTGSEPGHEPDDDLYATFFLAAVGAGIVIGFLVAAILTCK